MLDKALNRLCKWRAVFASWQLGTRSVEDPEAQAVKDHREVTILLRAEMSAIVAVLVKKKLIAYDDFTAQLLIEAQELERMYERRFPGAEASNQGMVFTKEAAEWLSKFKP